MKVKGKTKVLSLGGSGGMGALPGSWVELGLAGQSRTRLSLPDGVVPRAGELRRALEKLQPNDHLCLIYETSQRRWHAVIPFLAIGLERGEKCIYLGEAGTIGQVRIHLRGEGVDVMAAESSGQLLISADSDPLAAREPLNPHRMIALLIAETKKAVSEGYPALRVAAEMSRTLRGYWDSGKLLEYEARLNRDFFPKYPCVMLCQYDRWQSDPEAIKGAIVTHPLVAHANCVYPNFYYIPPEQFLSSERAEREVQNWLNSLEREHGSRERMELLADALKHSSQPFAVSYPDGSLMICNPAFRKLTGYSQHELPTMTWVELTPLEWRECDLKVLDKALSTRQPQRYEKELVRKDGSRVPIEVLVDVVLDCQGRLQYCYSFVTDITERKRAETELLVSREQLRHLLSSSPAVIYSWKASGDYGFTFVSDNVVSELGYEPQELLKDSRFWIDRIHPDDAPRVVAGISRLLEQGHHADEYRFVHSDGIYRWIHDEMTLVRDEAGHPFEIVGCWIDATERKVAEEALRESLRSLCTLIDNLPGVVYRCACNRTMEFVSEGCVELTGYKPSDLRQDKVVAYAQLIHPQDRERVWNEIQAALRESKPFQLEYRIVTASGAEKWVWERGRGVWSDQGELLALEGFITDVTERQPAEEGLREVWKLTSAVLDTSCVLVVVLDRKGRIVYLNRACENLTGYGADELRGRRFWDVFPTPEVVESVKGVFEKLGSGQLPNEHENYCVTRDGNRRLIAWSSTVLRDADGSVKRVVSIGTDITERKRAEEALKYHLTVKRAVAQVSTVLASEGGVDLNRIAAILGEAVGASRAYILQAGDGGEKVDNVWEWCAPGVEPQIQNLQNLDPSKFPWGVTRLRRNKNIVIPDVSRLPEEAAAEQHLLEAGGVRSALVVPMFSAGKVLGLLGFGDTRRVREWFEEDVRLLRTASESLVAYVERTHARDKVREGIEKLRRTLDGIVSALAATAESRDPYTAGHQQRVCRLACAIAHEMGLPEEQVKGLRVAATLHDMGKISVPAEILNKPGRITDVEMGIIKTHPQVGYDILKAIEFPWPVAQTVLQHHERLDGSGYPSGLSGEEILLEARILGVADVVESMSSHRPYRPALGVDRALEEISRNSGVLYDPVVVDACLKVFRGKEIAFLIG